MAMSSGGSGGDAKPQINVTPLIDVLFPDGIDVDYGRVVSAIDTIRKQDIDKIGLVADRKKGVEQPK